MAAKAFQEMDEQLDLALVPVETIDLQVPFNELAEEFPEVEELRTRASKMNEGRLWSKQDERVYCETQLVVPRRKITELITFLHQKLGHPSKEKLFSYWQRRFFTKDEKQVREKMKALLQNCESCARAKINTATDRGQQGSLPIPLVLNAEVAFDLVHVPEENNISKVLFLMETLTGFVQIIPQPGSVSEEDIARTVWEQWISKFGAPGRMTADNDVRWSNRKGKFCSMLKFYGTEMHYTTPYRSESNGRLERHVGNFNKTMRIAKIEHPTWSWTELLPIVTSVMNAIPKNPSGYSSAELFLLRFQWDDYQGFSNPAEMNSNSAKFQQAFQKIKNEIISQRSWRYEKTRQRHSESDIRAGNFSYVHHSRFLRGPWRKYDSTWLGRFL